MATNATYEQSKKVAEAGRETEWRLPSFGKELFLGRLDLDLIHPQPPLDPADVERGEAFLEKLRAFLTENVDPMQIERDARIPEEVIDGLKEIGAFGMKIPSEYGGLGLSQVYYNRSLAIAGMWHSALATILSAHQSIGLPQPLRLYGSEEQKREWLPKLATTHISAFLLTEPRAGSDPARVETQAVPTDDGLGYRITGEKLWATNGTVADVVVVMAVVPPAEGHPGGITAFIVPYDLEGITVVARNEFMGLRGIENSLTRFENVYVPKENVIGKEGIGLKIALKTLNTGRLSLPALSAAAARYALKISREFANEREQWGKPVGKHDPVAQLIAFITGSAFGLQAVVDVSSRLADDKRNDIRIEAAIAKLYESELGWRVADAMVQVRGGRGYETAESLLRRGERPVPAEQMIRDLRINRVFEGSSEIMRLLIAREALDQHLKQAMPLMDPGKSKKDKLPDALKAGKFYAGWLPQQAVGDGIKPRGYHEFGKLARHLRWAERAARRLAVESFYAMSRYGAGLEYRGHLLGRMVDIGAEVFAVSAACVYADTLSRETPARKEEAFELADLFCRQARRRADALFHSLHDNDDKFNYAAAQKTLEGRYAWLEDGLLDPADAPLTAKSAAGVA